MAYHDRMSGSIERGNTLGERSTVRQSSYFRQYESGNNVKDLLGTGNLKWDVDKKEGVFAGHSVYDGRNLDYKPATPQPQYQAPPPPPQQPAPKFGRRSNPAEEQPFPPTGPVRARGGAGGMDWLADALWQAVGNRDLTGVQRLLRQGADPNMVCPDGWVRDENRPKEGGVGRSVLHHAAWAGDLPIFKALVEAGADVGRKRNTAWRPNGGVRGRGSTPMHHACMYNRIKIVEFCLDELGCEIDTPGEQGYTCLHLAAKFNYPKLVEFLLQRGARTDMLTRDEKTARELAQAKQERSHEQMGDMLAAFDKFDAEARRRPKGLPGAPLPPDPRTMQIRQSHQEKYYQPPTQPQPPPPQPAYHHSQPAYHHQQPYKPQQQEYNPPPPPPPVAVSRITEGDYEAAYRWQSQQEQQQYPYYAQPPQPQQPPPQQQMVYYQQQPPPRPLQQAQPQGGPLRPDQEADRKAAETRARAMGSRPW